MIQKKLNTFFKEPLDPLKTTRGRQFGRNGDEKYLTGIPWPIIAESELWESKAIRRMPFKTQVFCQPENPHIRNRMIHTFDVISVIVRAAAQLGLNIDFCRVIAIAHDFGHGPYGHLFETITGIKHPLNGANILHHIERKGIGLNLNYEIYKAVMNHSRDRADVHMDEKEISEISLLVWADKIAYTMSDTNDLKREGLILEKDMPEGILKLGNGINAQRKREESCIIALVEESLEKGKISFTESEEAKIFKETRDWLYKNIYTQLDYKEERIIMGEELKIALEHIRDNSLCGNLAPEFALSLATDPEVRNLIKKLNKKNLSKKKREKINIPSLSEIIPSLNGKEIDHTKSPLW
ncbi:MAG: HD domain-containing protein [bacterium]|nr:HD domain-containing protein [bacterium]